QFPRTKWLNAITSVLRSKKRNVIDVNAPILGYAVMKNVILVFFCLVSSASLGVVAATFMAGNFAMIFGSTGLIIGTALGLMLSPFVLIYRTNDKIFAIVAVCFMTAFPIAVIGGFCGILCLAVNVTAFTVL